MNPQDKARLNKSDQDNLFAIRTFHGNGKNTLFLLGLIDRQEETIKELYKALEVISRVYEASDKQGVGELLNDLKTCEHVAKQVLQRIRKK